MDFRRLISPSFWIQLHPTSKTYDKWLNDFLDQKPKITTMTEHVAAINGVSFWVANYPHAFATVQGKPPVLAYVGTRKRFYNYITDPNNWV